MPEEQDTSQEGAKENPAMEDSPKTFGQDEVNKIVRERLAKEKAKYADFDKYKADSERLAELEEANKTELEKANDRAAKAIAERDALVAEKQAAEWKRAASDEFGVPADVIEGSDEDSIRAHAERLAQYMKQDAAPVVKSDGRTPPQGGASTAEQFARALDNVF